MLNTLKSKTEEYNDVFQSRGAFEIKKYINRPHYENEFFKALKSKMCILIRGNSGCGKSWLTNYLTQNSKRKWNVRQLT